MTRGRKRTRLGPWTVAVFGPDGAGKTAVINSVVSRLGGAASGIETRHLRPHLPTLRRQRKAGGPVVNPHARPAKPPLVSALQLAVWVASYWFDKVLVPTGGLQVRIYDRYYHDVLVDPRRYRYGGSAWFARLLARAVPQPDLVIILDAPAEVLRSRKQEVTEEETVRQRMAYLELASAFLNSEVVDAVHPLEKVVGCVETKIVELGFERTPVAPKSGSRS